MFGKKKSNEEVDPVVTEQAEPARKKPFYKKKWFWIIIVILVIIGLFGSGDEDEEETEEAAEEAAETETETEAEDAPLYAQAESVDMWNGSDTEIIGAYSILMVDSSEVGFEDIEEWYFDYVVENADEFDCFFIIYEDTEAEDEDDVTTYTGVYGIATMVQTDVLITKKLYGTHYSYAMSSTDETKLYYPSDDTLVEYVSSDETETSTEEEDSVTEGMQNALSRAKSYLNYTAFSYTGLIEQLEYEGYTTEEATYAVDNCGADWYEQALEKAGDYLDYTSFSYSGLIEQLEYEGFTTEEATYAADNCGADWYEQAVLCAQDYLDYKSFSRSGLIDQLEYEGFTAEQAEYAADAVGL